jgi:hypothetical protein
MIGRNQSLAAVGRRKDSAAACLAVASSTVSLTGRQATLFSTLATIVLWLEDKRFWSTHDEHLNSLEIRALGFIPHELASVALYI